MIFDERDKISADCFMEMEHVSGLEIINEKFESPSSKSSCLEDKNDLEVKDSSCQVSCLDKGQECEFKDVLPLRPVKLSLFDSSIHFQNDGLTETSSSSSDQTEDEEMISEIQTPTKTIFDPFAPGADDLMLAPKKKKSRDSYAPLRRRLNFDADSDSNQNAAGDPLKDFDEEELQFWESISNSLFEMIISSQLKEISDEAMVADSDYLEGCQTPSSSPLLSGVAETCPPAPMRPKLILGKQQSDKLCRKLDFGSNLS
ncbi:uncharacterized protein LOC110032372 [Phalaenopsis equestris]|uniref:uncharacterized protein LOC110032372 n=1 Tax=Phalaenopsis equestris TaxID=78828 RepID=UPI0009E5AAE2|nr:uncharacterized protein LOC110032372 [Phalaenopsis equestris]